MSNTDRPMDQMAHMSIAFLEQSTLVHNAKVTFKSSLSTGNILLPVISPN